MRVVATHDFCCAYPPSPTSYGSLPGGEGLKHTVDALRAQGPTLRADAGDFAAPGALATLSGGVAIGHAEDLRASGVEWVVALLHDGVDWRFGAQGYEAHPERLSEVCGPWARSVDTIFASHTLGRWIGRVEGTPVVQP